MIKSNVEKWYLFFQKEFSFVKEGLTYISNKSINFGKYIFFKKYNSIFNIYSRKEYLFRVFFTRTFIDRFYAFFFWNGSYKYNIDRKYNSIIYSTHVKNFSYFWFSINIFSKIKSFLKLFINKFILLIIRKNIGFSSSIFSSFFLIYSILINYFCSSNIFKINVKNVKSKILFNAFDFTFFFYFLNLKYLLNNKLLFFGIFNNKQLINLIK